MSSNYLQPQLGIAGLVWTLERPGALFTDHVVDVPLTNLDDQFNYKTDLQGTDVQVQSMVIFPGGVRLTVRVKSTASLGSVDLVLHRRSVTDDITLTGLLEIAASGGASSNKPVDLEPFETIGGGVGSTNLGNSPGASTVEVSSSSGSNTTLPAATTSLAGVMTGADKTKLNGVTGTNTGDQKFRHTEKMDEVTLVGTGSWNTVTVGSEYNNKTVRVILQSGRNNRDAGARESGSSEDRRFTLDNRTLYGLDVNVNGSGNFEVYREHSSITCHITGIKDLTTA